MTLFFLCCAVIQIKAMGFVTHTKPLKSHHPLMTSSKFYNQSWKLFVWSSKIKIRDFINSTKNENNTIQMYFLSPGKFPHLIKAEFWSNCAAYILHSTVAKLHIIYTQYSNNFMMPHLKIRLCNIKLWVFNIPWQNNECNSTKPLPSFGTVGWLMSVLSGHFVPHFPCIPTCPAFLPGSLHSTSLVVWSL